MVPLLVVALVCASLWFHLRMLRPRRGVRIKHLALRDGALDAQFRHPSNSPRRFVSDIENYLNYGDG